MRTFSSQEKRTIRLALGALVIFLALAGGLRASRFLTARRTEYRQLVAEAKNLSAELQRYQTRAEMTAKLMENFHLDPAKLSRPSVVGETSAAIQKVATAGGLQLGPIRESSARSSAREMASMQLDGSGPVSAVMTFLHRFDSLGFPLIIDSVQLTPDPMKPSTVKVHMTIVILDFELWKGEERPNA